MILFQIQGIVRKTGTPLSTLLYLWVTLLPEIGYAVKAGS